MKTTDFTRKAISSIIEHANDFLTDGRCVDVCGCDLHNKIFNEDYFIIYHSRAIEWLKNNDVDTFDAIETVFDYEKDNFGEVTTEVNPEKIVNMYVYILGEVVLSESEHLQKKWDVRLTEKDCKKIAKELSKI